MKKQIVASLAAIVAAACTRGASAVPKPAPNRPAAQGPATALATGCELSGSPKSTLAWESGLAEGRGPATAVLRDAIVGRVIAVRNGEAVVGARIRLDPGNHFAVSDSTGRFAFPPLPQGRYRVNVVSLGSGSIADSVTLGFDGLRLVAALATYRGDLVCTGRVRAPSNER